MIENEEKKSSLSRSEKNSDPGLDRKIKAKKQQHQSCYIKDYVAGIKKIYIFIY